jgi:glutamate/tyrosine decarboxylase-like PLP-dependent enzyme
MFSGERARLLAGIERADSVTLDPHKWLFQPYEIGCVLVRDRSWLRRTFEVRPEYLRDVRPEQDEVNFCDHGVQLTRSFRALKLWMTLKVFGADAVAEAIDHGFRLAELAERWLETASGWEVVSPARMGIVCFRYQPSSLSDAHVDALNEAIVKRMMDEGYALVLTTLIGGHPMLRLCSINPRTSEQDVEATLHRLDEHARALCSR